MADLSTRYLGLTLKNPVIAGSSGLMSSVENCLAAEKAGAAAVILKSVFEEQIRYEVRQELAGSDLGVHPEAMDYISGMTREHSIDQHLKLISGVKSASSIPVIASINCVSHGDWIEYSRRMQDAGADALELNVFISDYSSEIEGIYKQILDSVKAVLTIPVAMKISSQITNLPRMSSELCGRGVDGLVFFNRYWSPDIDIENRKVIAAPPFSHPDEYVVSLRWIAMLAGTVPCDLCGSTGIHNAETVIKFLMAGASTVQVCSLLYKNGLQALSGLVQSVDAWLHAHGFSSVDDIRGIVGTGTDRERTVWGRTQFMKYYAELE